MSSYSEGQTHQLVDAMETAGLTSKHITRLGQSQALLENIRRILDGEAHITLDGGVISTLKAVIDRRNSFDVAMFLGRNDWTVWKGPADGNGLVGDEEQDTRSLALGEIDTNQIRLVPTATLKHHGESIWGEERLRRLRMTGQILLDAAILLQLWQNQHLIPEAWKEKTKGNCQLITFDGTIFRNPEGHRAALQLGWIDGRWDWNVYWLDNGASRSRVSAVLAS